MLKERLKFTVRFKSGHINNQVRVTWELKVFKLIVCLKFFFFLHENNLRCDF